VGNYGKRNFVLCLTVAICCLCITSVAQDSLVFGNQTVGTMSAPQTHLIQNPSSLFSLSFRITLNTADFVIGPGDTCAFNGSLGPNQSCNLNIAFAPTSIGPKTATATIEDLGCALGCVPQTIFLSGTGVAAPPPPSPTPTPAPRPTPGPGSYIALDFNTALAHVFDATTSIEVKEIKVGASPESVVISPNGRLAFVANLNAEFVSVIDLTIGAEIKRIRNIRITGLAIAGNGTTLVGPNLDNDGLTVIDANSLTVTRTISLNGLLGDDPAQNPDNIIFTPVIVGNKAFVNTLFDFGVVDLDTGSVTDLGSNPIASGAASINSDNLAASADGKFVLVNRQGAILIIDTATNTVVKSVSALGFVFSISASRNAGDPAKVYGYVLRATGLIKHFTILDLSSGSPSFGSIIGDLTLPAEFPTDIVAHIGPTLDGTRAFVTTATGKPNIYVIDTSIASLPILVGTGFSIGTQLRGVTAGGPVTQPPTTAPVVSSVSTPLVSNDVPSTLQISGSGFSPDAEVRIGSLDPQPAQFLSSSLLQITIAPGAPAQGAPIIVTNSNIAQGVAGANQSGILRNALVIASAPTFQPVNQAVISNFGDATFSIFNLSTNATLSPTFLAPDRMMGVAITPDGSRAYIERFVAPSAVDVFNFATNSFEAHIPLTTSPAGLPGQTRGIVIAPRFGSGKAAAYVASSRRVAPGTFALDLYVIDADPTSTTFNSIVATFPTGDPNPSVNPGGLAVTPDGRFVFINGAIGSQGSLVALDLSTGVSTLIPTSALGVSSFQPAPGVSSDGKFIVLHQDNGNLAVFDITNPPSPALLATISVTRPVGSTSQSMIPRISGNLLYGFDPGQNLVAIFNFNPASNDFAQLATFVVPGATTAFAPVHDVTPDGKLLYLPLKEEDSIAVVDTAKVLANDPTALLTKIGTGISPFMAAVRPGTPTPAGTNVTVQPIFPVALTFGNVTAAGATSATTTNTNPDPLPAGFSLGTPPVYYEISTTAVFTGSVQVCISYNPAQFAPPEAAIRLLHDESGVFVDRTTSLDTANHIVCGSVTHFSAFTIGTASIDFLYDSLLREVRTGVNNAILLKQLADKVADSREDFNDEEIAEAIEELLDLQKKVQKAVGRTIDVDEATRLISLSNAIILRLQVGG